MGESQLVKLEGLSEKIFLDRYALKDADVNNVKVGDTILVLVKDDPQYPTKEVGLVTERSGANLKVELRNGETIDTVIDKITLTVENSPSEMWDRLAGAMASVEKTPELQEEWRGKFRNLLDDWKLVPGGRIAAGADANDELTLFNCFGGETIVQTKQGPRRIDSLSGEVEVLSQNGIYRKAYFKSYGEQKLYAVELATGEIYRTTAGHQWLTSIEGERITTLELNGRFVPQLRPIHGDTVMIPAEWQEGLLVPQFTNDLEGFSTNYVQVSNVYPLNIVEKVYCCDEPETHSFVIGSGTLTGNCYVIPSPQDSRGGIMQTLSEMTEIMSRGGGVGINISSLRPHRAIVRGVNGSSSGSVSWGGLFSYTTGLIEQGGSRRGALMLMIHDWHPDVEQFITVKQQSGLITNANLSVCVSNDFMKAVKEDLDWDLVFPDTSVENYDELWDGDLAKWKAAGRNVIHYRTVKARYLWDQIIESAWKSAEPGVVFMEYYNEMSNSWYFNPIICTNPCGEQGLPAWGVCNLSALNLSKFYDEVSEDVNWTSLSESVRYAVRFLDNVITKTPYHFEENRINQTSERRVGLGTMGLAELLIKLKVRYGSAESLEFLDKLYGFIAAEAYLESSALAAEKGSFDQFDADKLLQSGFLKNMVATYPEVGEAIRAQGLRNVTVLTQAPTGSTGTMVGTSTGIEPYFAFKYFRQSRLGYDMQYVPIAQDWLDAHPGEELPEYFVTAMQLSAKDHVRTQAAIQRWVDSSISKTANAPNDFTVEETRELYELAFDLGCKGVTIYRDGCRDVQVLSTEDKS